MSKRTARIFVYKAKDGWRWRLKSANGKMVCESGESYKRKPSPEMFTGLGVAMLDANIEYPQ